MIQIGSGKNDNNVGLPYVGTVTQVNPVKEYRYGEMFFVRVIGADGKPMLCMFDPVHRNKFSVKDRIGFEASNSGDEWYRISATKEVKNLGGGKIPEVKKSFLVDYVSYPKSRHDREDSSYCLVGEDWLLELPVSVMQEYFEGKQDRQMPKGPVGPGPYGQLRVPQNATEIEIRKAFRAMARKYHPDVSDVPDAKERFQAINDAYQKLVDPVKREKVDAILGMMGRKVDEMKPKVVFSGFTPPYRCGKIDVIAKKMGGSFQATKIESWQARFRKMDIVVDLTKVDFHTWGIAVPESKGYQERDVFGNGLQRSGFEIEANKLPERLNNKGTLEVTVKARQVAWWAGRQDGKAMKGWEIEDVISTCQP